MPEFSAEELSVYFGEAGQSLFEKGATRQLATSSVLFNSSELDILDPDKSFCSFTHTRLPLTARCRASIVLGEGIASGTIEIGASFAADQWTLSRAMLAAAAPCADKDAASEDCAADVRDAVLNAVQFSLEIHAEVGAADV